DEEMARACEDKSFCKNFKLLAAQEIVKFNPNVEGPKSKHQTNSTIENIQPMIDPSHNQIFSSLRSTW
ncbi:hypothetical protein, partial [Enterobacter hormaechei]|uniref:hypothetical protein n=1 Tax=Enterobacter hormaechei TaxID=158836 RepID=UPI0023E45197